MPIPSNITKDHLLKAIEKIDQEGIPANGNSQYYDVIHKGRAYPPKLIVSYANIFANGEMLHRDTFDGGLDTECFKLLENHDFFIRAKQFFEHLEKFLAQSHEGILTTTGYPRQHKGLKVKVSFGQGNQARVSWIAFLGGNNTVQQGIYPVYLYYKEKNLLILAHGVSETNPPNSSWDITNSTTIADFFLEKFNERPPRYGQSYVYRAYDLNSEKPIEEIWNFELNNLLDDYKTMVGAPTSESIDNLPGLNEKETINHVYKYISSEGFRFQLAEISNFYLSLKTKPFVILAGVSGTGKTQLPRKFAEALGMGKEQLIQIPVRPDWTDGSDLLGYTGLDGQFKPKALSEAIKTALEEGNRNKPFFFILDEMNLARMEHYFSDFLSIIETRQWLGDQIVTDPILRKETLDNALNKEAYQDFHWPENLYLIGTVNMDETTHAFSRKVLDRANSIEMNDIDLDWTTLNGQSVEPLAGISNSFFKSEYLHSRDLPQGEKDAMKNELEFLKRVNAILQEADLHFAYRVRDEIAFYLRLNGRFKLLDKTEAMDFQLMQKILPRIHGSSERVQKVLVNLYNYLKNKEYSHLSIPFEEMFKDLENEKNFKRSLKKIIFMLKRYEDDGFTSFWL